MKLHGSCCLVLAFAACSDSTDTRDVEANDLGVTTVTVTRSTGADGTLLDVKGFTANGNEVASVHMKSGPMMYTVPDTDQTELVDGVSITVTSGTETFTDVAPDHLAHAITEHPLAKSLRSFVRIHAVADEIKAELGITFAPVSTEAAYNVYSCDAGWFTTGVSDCCGSDTGSSNLYQNAVSNGVIGYRFINNLYQHGCRASDGQSAGTYYGPCGGTGKTDISGGPSPHVFNGGSTCGWDDGNRPGTWGSDYYPVYYPGNGDYGGVGANCNCTGCSNGTPTPSGCHNAWGYY